MRTACFAIVLLAGHGSIALAQTSNELRPLSAFEAIHNLALRSIPKFLERRLDELIEKRYNHYRQMMGCTPSGPSEFVP